MVSRKGILNAAEVFLRIPVYTSCHSLMASCLTAGAWLFEFMGQVRGPELMNLSRTTLGWCGITCTNTPGCAGFTWNLATCSLKSSIDPVMGPYDPSVVSARLPGGKEG